MRKENSWESTWGMVSWKIENLKSKELHAERLRSLIHLIRKGADLECKNETGKTILMLASEN